MAVNYLGSVPRLLGRENYADWCYAIENVFILEGLSKCLDNTETDTVLQAKAKAKIILTLDTSIYTPVRGKETCFEVWNALKNLYEDNGYMRKIGLLRKLISLRYENCNSMEAYVSDVIETSRRLSSTGFKINEEWIGSLLLAGLLEKFSPMIMAIEHSGIEITSDRIKSKLLDIEKDSEITTANAFAGKANFNKRVSSSGAKNDNRKQIICYKCKQPGHFKNECPKLAHNGKKDDENKSHAFSVVFINGNFNSGDWYIDFAASNHVTAREDWMADKQKPTVEEIVVANNETLPVKSLGKVNVTTVVGKRTFDITVHDILYVPKLATNL